MAHELSEPQEKRQVCHVPGAVRQEDLLLPMVPESLVLGLFFRGRVDPEIHFHLRRELGQDHLLCPAKDEGSHQVSKKGDPPVLFFPQGVFSKKPPFKLEPGSQESRHQEVHDPPEVGEAVFDWSSCYQHPLGGGKGNKGLVGPGLGVLDGVGFVQNQAGKGRAKGEMGVIAESSVGRQDKIGLFHLPDTGLPVQSRMDVKA